ncbi:PDZ domain-containing protein, partial [Candidatus Woesearchaeota archaeon]|nr:PDZ domain-containing protein [Candidatus Woesearchaeota archaeon]
MTMKLENIKSLFKQWRILFLLFCLILSYFMIQPSFFTDGAAIRSIEKNSPAALAGIHSPSGKDKPMFREIITTVNGKSISTVDDFAAATANFQEGDLVQISTLARYTYDGSDRKLHIFRQELSYNLYYNATTGLGIEVYDAP